LNPTTDTCDISVVVNAHREGLLLLPSLRSAAASIEQAEKLGLRCELVVALDRPDDLTREMAAHAGTLVKSVLNLQLDFGDLGESRNSAVKQSRGKYVAFLDGDDLFCSTWLRDAFGFAESDARLLVLHPDFSLYFGPTPHVFKHVGMDDPSYETAMLAFTNLWTALCFAPRDLLLRCPYPRTDLSRQVGYEDWGWNMRVVAEGALHLTVPRTFHVVRQKAISLVRQTSAAGCFPAYPPGLFEAEKVRLDNPLHS
jgi:glycosyltransferase involved in cell wall biosynthesis